MSESKQRLNTPGISAIEAAKQLRDLGGFSLAPGLSAEGAERMRDRIALIPASPRKPWYRRIDIEKIAVVLIAIFVAAIAVNHFRLVNARVEAARPCVDQRR